VKSVTKTSGHTYFVAVVLIGEINKSFDAE
jgi:hypothetical protein